ncbi:hypothetical protein J6590_071240 [Homalodisca vitripennis]|nr:hypothetical protein J6590_071240 [Homalodisca vitripennis]
MRRLFVQNDADSIPLRLALHQYFLGFEQSLYAQEVFSFRPNQSLQNSEPMMICHVKKEHDRGEEYHNGVVCSCYTVAIFCNTLSRQRHAPHHSTAPSQLNDRYYTLHPVQTYTDFNHYKQMSQGVAAVLKDNFGKPRRMDYCAQNLTCQKYNKGAAVYGLVTKPKYFLNSENYDKYMELYDGAFQQLGNDFKRRNLKTLICSPMGCVRDRVPPYHFIKNIKQFSPLTLRVYSSDKC